jgi:ABC-type molybdate transport system substrate-binding protein
LVSDTTVGGWTPVPSETYDRPVQAIVVIAPSGAPNRQLAEGFAAFVRSPEGLGVLAGVGFAPPPPLPTVGSPP